MDYSDPMAVLSQGLELQEVKSLTEQCRAHLRGADNVTRGLVIAHLFGEWIAAHPKKMRAFLIGLQLSFMHKVANRLTS